MKTMDCTDIKALLSALVDDCVEPDTRHLAERHLADCKSCRTLLDETEAAEAMVAASVNDLVVADALPDGFAANVLARTVYSEEKYYHPHRWTTWLGWVAAAASLALALTLWVVDNSGNLQSPKSTIARNHELPNNSSDLSLQANQESPNIYFADDSRASFAELNSISMMPASLRRTSVFKKSSLPLSSLSLDDIDTLDQTAQLLMMLAQAPEQSQIEIERIKRIAEYDELLPKLSILRAKLALEDRSNAYAAELLLQRIIQDQLIDEDVQQMRNAVNELNLPSLIDEIASFARRAISL